MRVLLLLVLLLTPVWAATRYVSTHGNNANACATSQSPGASAKRSLNGAQGAIACMQGGDTLVVQDGVFNEQLSDVSSAEYPGTTRPPSGLSWSQPTVIRAEHPRGATLNKPQPGAPYGHVVMFGYAATQYLSVEGLVIDGRGHHTCVWVGPSSHIRLQGNVVKNCGSNGIYGGVADDGSGGQDIQLLDNEIFNIATEHAGPPGTHAIYFTGNNSVARGNYIHAPCPFYGLQYSSEKGGLHHNVIENNRIVGCDQAGIISQGSDTTIRNNLLENNCIGLYLGHGGTQVLHNTIVGYHTAPHCPDSYGILDKSYGSTLSNNLVLQQGAGWRYIYAMQTPPTMHTNLCDATGDHRCQQTVSDYRTVLVDAAQGDLHLKPGSAAVNTGTTLASVPMDKDGVARPQGSSSDIGAYEFASTPPPGDTTAPTVAITAPSHGALISGQSVAFTATASDDVGVIGVQWYVGGEPRRDEQTVPPYGATIDSTQVPNGNYVLTAVARDGAGNRTTSAPITVTVFNGPVPPPTPAHPALACAGELGAAGVISLRCAPEKSR